jgi:predicted flap endonuclease-1-like 5' DNA nuclease
MSKDVRKMMEDMQDRIREVAYLMWESAGRQHGMATEYWHAAEREVRSAFEAASEKMKPSASAPKPEPKPAAPVAKEAAKPAPVAKPAAKKPAKAPASAKKITPTTGYKIEQIEGIGPAYAKKLASAGIETTDHLLDQCGSAKGRAAVAGKAGVTEKVLLKWANMADLMRISGVGGEFAELLEAAGVDTVKELKTRSAENLAAKMAEINAEKKLTRRLASAKQIGKWVEQAKSLEPKITH